MSRAMMTMCCARGALLAVVVGLGSTAADAHVTIRPNEVPAGSYVEAALNVAHGCDGSATVAVRVKIPNGVLSVKPQMKPGWNVEIKKRTLDAPLAGLHGKTVTEVIDEVSWRGGPLPDHLYDSFGLQMKTPDGAGQTLYFPVVQECEQGVNRWIEVPAAGQSADKLHEPAPALRLKPKAP